jgi:O-antigen/teichoic acid export membrane protein
MFTPINKYKKISQLNKNLSSGVIYSGISSLISLIAFPIYLKYLGTEIYGLWATVSVILEFSVVGQLRIETALTKYVAQEYRGKNFKAITEYISTSFYILLVPFLLVLIGLALFRYKIASLINLKESFMHDGIRLIFYVGILSGLSFFVNALRGVVVGIGRMDIANYIFLLSGVLRVIFTIYLQRLGLGVWSQFFGWLLYYILPSIIWVMILRYNFQLKVFDPFGFRIKKLKQLLKLGGTLLLATVANMFVIPFNKLIIARYIGLSAVTFYQIAYQLINAVRGLFVLSLESIIPRASELYKKTVESLSSVLSVHKKGMIFVFFWAFPLFLSLFIFSNPILRLWLGKNFDMQISVSLRILIIGWLINALAVPDFYMFIGIGKAGYSTMATCLKSIMNVIFISALIVLNLHFTLTKVVVIDSISLIGAVIYLKFRFIRFKNSNGVAYNFRLSDFRLSNILK